MARMKTYAFAILISLATTPLQAETCPAAPDHTDELSALISAVQGAENERDARLISNDMWTYWADAPDEYSQELLDTGMERRRVADYAGAAKAFDALVDYCPDYAEGYNQRAFINFLREDFNAALPDLERTIDLSPRHVAALAGKALTLAALDRNAEAVLSLRRALALNPWLSERHLLPVLERNEDEL